MSIGTGSVTCYAETFRLVMEGTGYSFQTSKKVFSMLLRNGHQRRSTGTVQDIFMPIGKKSSVTENDRKNSGHVPRLPALCFSTMQEPG